MELLAQMALGGGNTNSPPIKKEISKNSNKTEEKRPSGAKRWLFTWVNYPEDWMAQMAPVLDETLWIAGFEICPDTKSPHIQGYVEFPNKVRPIGYKGCNKKVHWGDEHGKPCRAKRPWCVDYCTKDGDIVPGGTLKVPRKIKLPPMDKQWEKDIIEIVKTEPDDRTIYWYWSEEGNIGKTTFCKYLCLEHDACLLSGKGADVRNGAMTWKKDKGMYPDLCVFPIPRSFNSDYISYEAIENVKDALFYSGKYEGGTVCDACPHVFVFANFVPDMERMSNDRWNIVNIDEQEIASGSPPGALRGPCRGLTTDAALGQSGGDANGVGRIDWWVNPT